MNYAELGEKVKAKYPEYKDVDSAELGQRTAAKYPEYKAMITVDTPMAPAAQPTATKPQGISVGRVFDSFARNSMTPAGPIMGANELANQVQGAAYDATFRAFVRKMDAQKYGIDPRRLPIPTSLESLATNYGLQSAPGISRQDIGEFVGRSIVDPRTYIASGRVRGVIDPIAERAMSMRIPDTTKRVLGVPQRSFIQKTADEFSKLGRSNEIRTRPGIIKDTITRATKEFEASKQGINNSYSAKRISLQDETLKNQEALKSAREALRVAKTDGNKAIKETSQEAAKAIKPKLLDSFSKARKNYGENLEKEILSQANTSADEVLKIVDDTIAEAQEIGITQGKPFDELIALRDNLGKMTSNTEVVFDASLGPIRKSAELTAKDIVGIRKSLIRTLSAQAKAGGSFTPEDVITAIFDKNLGGNLKNLTGPLRQLNGDYKEFMDVMKFAYKKFQPKGEFDVARGASLLRKIALDKADPGELAAIQKLQGGTKLMPGVGDITSSVKSAETAMQKSVSGADDLIKQINQSKTALTRKKMVLPGEKQREISAVEDLLNEKLIKLRRGEKLAQRELDALNRAIKKVVIGVPALGAGAEAGRRVFEWWRNS